MYTIWTEHLKDPEDKSRFENAIVSSKDVLERLKSLLEKKEQILDRSEIDPSSYDATPNWGVKQAHKNGYRQCLYELKKLVDLDQQKQGVQ